VTATMAFIDQFDFAAIFISDIFGFVPIGEEFGLVFGTHTISFLITTDEVDLRIIIRMSEMNTPTFYGEHTFLQSVRRFRKLRLLTHDSRQRYTRALKLQIVQS